MNQSNNYNINTVCIGEIEFDPKIQKWHEMCFDEFYKCIRSKSIYTNKTLFGLVSNL